MKTIPATKMIAGIVAKVAADLESRKSRSCPAKSLWFLRINSAVILQEIQWEKIRKLKSVVKLP